MHRSVPMTALICVAVAVPLAGGCISTPELNSVKKDIAHQIPGATFDHEMSFAIGPGGMALARAVVGFVPDTGDARAWLKDISRVEVAVYDVVRSDLPKRLETPRRIGEMMADGWEMAARVREGNEAVWVLYKLDGESVREIFVVALDREELVLVKLKGRLERVIARALDEIDREHPARAFHRRS